MASGPFKGKHTLVVAGERDVPDIAEDDPDGHHMKREQASTHGDAVERLSSGINDLAIVDLTGVRGQELLLSGMTGKVPGVAGTTRARRPSNVKKPIELSARAYLPEDRFGLVPPFLQMS